MLAHALTEKLNCSRANFESLDIMASMETCRCSAYHDDLRWRMVYQREALGYTYQRIAANLNVDTSTVWRTVQLFLNTGGVSKKKYNKDNLPRKVNESILF